MNGIHYSCGHNKDGPSLMNVEKEVALRDRSVLLWIALVLKRARTHKSLLKEVSLRKMSFIKKMSNLVQVIVAFFFQ